MIDLLLKVIPFLPMAVAFGFGALAMYFRHRAEVLRSRLSETTQRLVNAEAQTERVLEANKELLVQRDRRSISDDLRNGVF